MQRKITTPHWVTGKTIYEVNLRQFTKEGTIKAFEAHLPRLKEMGVGILWFMPIQPIGKKNRKGTLGSYYSVSNYTAVNPEFGSLEDYKALVKKCHELGLKVIIDWVANHTAWDHHWTKDHPEYFNRNNDGSFKPPVEDWEDVIHLDYGNPDLWDAMIGEMAYWLKETNLDGFRCDMAHLVPTMFWNRARRDLDKIKPVYMLAESENHDLLEYAFDTIYNWKLLHAMDDLVAGEINAEQLALIAFNELEYLPKGASMMNFTSNHDENSWQGSAIERINYFLEPLTVLTFLLPGFPLIYSGQEAGNYRRLKFFDKDEIEWKEDKMLHLYKKLAKIKSTHLSENNFGIRILEINNPEKIIAFEAGDQRKVITILNLSDKSQKVKVEIDNHHNLKNAFNSEEVNLKPSIEIESYKFLILDVG